jgi:hypothetical protein
MSHFNLVRSERCCVAAALGIWCCFLSIIFPGHRGFDWISGFKFTLVVNRVPASRLTDGVSKVWTDFCDECRERYCA